MQAIRQLTMKHRLAAVVLAAGLAIGSMVAVAGGGASNTVAAATSSGSTTATTTNGTTAAPPGATMNGRLGRSGGYGPGGSLTVTKVSGNTITASGRGGQTITVQVSSTTAYTEAGASAALSDVTVGARIAVQGTVANTSGTTINATGVTIVLPQVLGVVTNVNGSTLALTSFDGSTHTVTVSSSTRYQKAGRTAASTDVAVGTAIVAEGTSNSDGSLSAVRVTIQVPHLEGQVTAVSGTSITISGRDGTTYTVDASNADYVNADGSAASASAVKSGVSITAEGTLSSDGKTLTALRIVVMPAGQGSGGFGPHGGPGGFGGPLGSSSGAASTTADGLTSF